MPAGVKDDSSPVRKATLAEWLQFLREEAWFLRERPEVIAQQALNQPADTAPARAAELQLRRKPATHALLRWVNKPEQRSALMMTLTGHKGGVVSCAWSSDGSRIASCANDGTVRLWNSESGLQLSAFQTHRAEVCACSFTPDGREIVAVCADGTVMVWAVGAAASRSSFLLPGSSARVVISPDCARAALMGRDGQLHVYDLRDGVQDHAFHARDVTAFAWCNSGGCFALGYSDGLVEIRKLSETTPSVVFQIGTGAVRACAFLKECERILVSAKGLIAVNDAATGKGIALAEHTEDIWALAASPGGNTLVTGHKELTLRDADTLLPIARWSGHTDPVECCAYSPDGTRVVSASRDLSLRVWEVNHRIPVKDDGHSDAVAAVAFSPDSALVASSSRDRLTKLWSANTGRFIRALDGHTDQVLGCAIAPDGKHIATASRDRTVILWDVESGRASRILRGHADAVTSCDFSPDGRRVVSGATELKIWDTTSGREALTIGRGDGSVNCCAFSPDGTRIVSGDMSNRLRVWSAVTGALEYTSQGSARTIGGVTKCVFARDGSKLATTSGGTVVIWDFSTMTKLIEVSSFSLVGLAQLVRACAISPDGSLLVTGANDRTIRVWDTQTGIQLAEARPGGHFLALAWSDNGQRIAAGSSLGKLYLFEYCPGSLQPATFSAQ